MGRPQWKTAEARLAAFFGTRRRPLSGGNHNQGTARDDGQHPVIFLENKYGAKVAPWSLYLDTLKKANVEGRVPVLGLQQKGQTGMLLCFNSREMEVVCREWASANGLQLSPKEDNHGKETSSSEETSSVRRRKRRKRT